jgi:hypothetical protein
VNPVLQFGVYRGRRLNDTPPEYSNWLVSSYRGLHREHPEVFAAVLPRAIEYLERVQSGDLPPLERIPKRKGRRGPFRQIRHCDGSSEYRPFHDLI